MTQTVQAQADAGAAAAGTTLQSAYDASGVAQPKVLVTAANGPVSIRDAAVPIGFLFLLEDNAGVDLFNVGNSQLNFGLATQRLYSDNNLTGAGAAYGGRTWYPDDFTQIVAGQSTHLWNSTLTSSIPGGGGIGNETAPNFVTWAGEVILTEQGNLFNTQSLFNQSTIITCQGANTGPIYTMINQPLLRTGAAGGSRTGSQQNAVRSQLRLGPNLAGNFALTSHEAFLATVIANATVGTVSCATVNYFAPKAPTLTAGATIGTLNCMDIPNIPAAGITTLRGINSAMNSGLFLNHTGSADSHFSGSIQFDDFDGIRFGGVSPSAGDATLFWNGTLGELRVSFALNSDQLAFSNPGANRFLIAGNNGIGEPGDEFNLACRAFTLGANTGAVGNGVGQFVAGVRTTQIGGEWTDFLLTQAANLTVNIAGMNTYAWTINAISHTLSGPGTVLTSGALNVGGNPNQGSVNRFGIRVLSNPSGGSGVNAALWITAGLSRFDGRVDINNGIALGGGAAATLGTIGGAGPTAAAQAQWVEIDIGGTPHWIPAWT